jgi:signal transduction histidine kinase/ActR/RegA family two-component response regulator
MVWRLVLSLFLHLTLLFLLAIYLVWSLNSVRLYTPVINAEENVLVSLQTLPALLDAMDTERRAWLKTGDPQDVALYSRIRRTALDNLDSLNTAVLLPSAGETHRRALARQWISEIGDVAVKQPVTKLGTPDAQGTKSRALLDELSHVTAQVRQEEQTTLAGLQNQQAVEANGMVTLMWFGVGTVSVVTILFQLIVANSIIGPIQTLAAAVRRMQRGDYTARVRLRSGDEIESLGETFNTMAENIQRNQQELEEKNARLSEQQEALRTANTSLEARVAEKTRELEDKNQKLSEAARLKDEFLATLSHELRTPLTPVITCAHLLGTDPSLDPGQLKNVGVIDRNARALSRMIDELLDLSAVMNNKLRLARERTEINEWARATLEALRPDWEKKQLDLTFLPAANPIELEIDPTRLAQVVTNLITNAIKYTAPHGKITVRISVALDKVRIAVTDNGTGLTQPEIDRIFEMFHQSRSMQTQNVGGLGVGLTVARSLAELHGGGLQAESPGPGQGATFTLWLPRHVNLSASQTLSLSTPSLPPPPSPADRTLLRGRRVLLVEDSSDTREALQRLFQRRECQVTTASSGEEGLEMALRETPEIIISDIGLPGISGLEFMTRLRARPEFRGVIAIALSGLGREQDIRGANEAGFDAHLLKPVDIAVLDETLIEALRRKHP